MRLCNGVKLSGTRRRSLAVRRPAGPGSLLRLVSAGLAGPGPVGGQGSDQVQVWSCREYLLWEC